MQIMEPTTAATDPTDLVVIVETDDHERVEFHAMSKEELEAKLDDFRTWAA